MQEYHRAMQLRALGETAKDVAKRNLAKGIASGVGLTGGAYLVKKALE